MNRIRFCSCGKMAYARREDAKVRIRECRDLDPAYLLRGRPPQTYYPCPEGTGLWHITGRIGTRAQGNRKPD